MDKALITGIVFCLTALFSLAMFWAPEITRKPASFSEPVPMLEVEDKPLFFKTM